MVEHPRQVGGEDKKRLRGAAGTLILAALYKNQIHPEIVDHLIARLDVIGSHQRASTSILAAIARQLGVVGPLPVLDDRPIVELGKGWLLDCFQSMILEAESIEKIEEDALLGNEHMHYG